MSETLSVVVPSYNHERFIGTALKSIFEQSRRPDELIVVDDGSKDGSLRLIERLLSESPIPRSELIAQKNAGAHRALNVGIESASGRWVALLNSDDYYYPDRFATMLAEAPPGQEGFLFSLLEVVDGDDVPLPSSNPWRIWYAQLCAEIETAPTIGFALLLHSIPVTSGNFVFSRSLYEKTGGFADFKFCHDWDFAMNCTRFVEPRLVSVPLMAYRVHGSNSTNALRSIQEREVEDALRLYAARVNADAPDNVLAPCLRHWPNFFGPFVEGRKFHFGTRPIADYLRGVA